MPKTTVKERIYLTEEERQILQSLLEEWNGKQGKKARDAFVASEAIPKVQQLNLEKFGPEVISKDKAANVLWERRIQVSTSVPSAFGSKHLL